MSDSRAAVEFLEKELNIQNVETRFREDKLDLLNEIIRGCYTIIPYHNFFLLSTPVEQRTITTRPQMIKNCLGKKGGSCDVLNTFLHFLLKSVGYNAKLQGCTLFRFPHLPVQHFVNLVTNINHPNDIYLADAGAWYPLFTAIDLTDPNLDSKIQYNSFCESYFTCKDNIVTRMHRKGVITEFTSPLENNSTWDGYYYFSIKDFPEEDVIRKALDDTYRANTICISTVPSFSIYPKGLGVTVSNNKLRIFDEEKKQLHSSIIESASQAVEIISKYAPFIDGDLVKTIYGEALSKIEKN